MDTQSIPFDATPRPQEGSVAVATATGLGVRRNDAWILRNLHLTLPSGCVIAVVGPSGSGHTRALLALGGRYVPDEGSVDVADWPAAIGWFPELAQLDDHLRPGQVVDESVRPDLASGQDVLDALERVGLAHRAGGTCAALTTQERVLLGLAWASLLPHRMVLVEATSVASVHDRVWEVCRDLAESGRVVVVGTTLAHPPAEILINIPWELPQ